MLKVITIFKKKNLKVHVQNTKKLKCVLQLVSLANWLA